MSLCITYNICSKTINLIKIYEINLKTGLINIRFYLIKITDRYIILVPITNARGYLFNVREEYNLDANRDFP